MKIISTLWLALIISSLLSCQPSNSQAPPKTAAATDISVEKKAKPLTKKTPDVPQTDKKYTFPWLSDYDAANMLVNRIAPPEGYERQAVTPNSFAEWLRHLPLKSGTPPVKLYNGELKSANVHVAVLDMDVGKQDLQQCADAVMRFRAEYLLQAQKHDDIHFNFTNGTPAVYSKWKAGYRPKVNGNKVTWQQTAGADGSYASFKQYMLKVFMFAGTASLTKELKRVDVADIQAGDVWIQGGHPGHAVLVMDVAVNPQTGKKVFLLSQSYMPAQESHILKNPNNSQLSPWYAADFEGDLQTPEWPFKKEDLKRF